MKKLLSSAIIALFILGPGMAQGAEGEALPERDWSFAGIFGHFDKAALQRGLQVYREVCAGCHSLNLITFRNLEALGYNEDEIKAIAAEYTVMDGPNDDGEMFERNGRPYDRFPAPFANAKAAAAANNGATPPDLSLMAKARVGGPDYIHALLTGYQEPPADFDLLEGSNYNKYFPGKQIAMAPPLAGEDVEYADGTEASVEQEAADLASFLMWAAEPSLEERKSMGIGVMLFLFVFTAVLYAAKRRVWADQH